MPSGRTSIDAVRAPVYAAILAGGYGTRFWPLSRQEKPKQFLALTGRRSLLRQTYRRLEGLFPPGHVFVVGNARHRRLIREELPDLRPNRLLAEPAGRNTAAAIALVAEHIRRHLGGRSEDAVVSVFPADHAIGDGMKFREVVRGAVQVSLTEDALVVLGIPPTHPHTGYGYIECGFALRRLRNQPVFAVRRFAEKPDPRTAARYLRTRRYFWNAGMFFFRLSVLDRMLKEYLPRTRTALRRVGSRIGKRDYLASLSRVYLKLRDISLDYAVAEPAAAAGKVRVLKADIGWSDLGSWSSIYDWHVAQGTQDAAANLISGESFTRDASGNLFQSEGKFIAAIGVHDLMVVETPDAILVCPRNRAQEVGEIVKHLKEKRQRQLL